MAPYNTYMYIFASQFAGEAILSLQTGALVATVTELVINPDKLELIAFLCLAPELEFEQPILTLQSIRQITRDCILIDHDGDISDAPQIVRLHQLISSGFRLLGSKVYTESGTYLGQTTDYSLNFDTKLVQRLTLRPTFFKRLLTDTFIIDREQIIDVKPDKITVRDATVPATKRSRIATPALHE